MSAVKDSYSNMNRQKLKVCSFEDEIQLLTIIQNDTKRVSVEKWLENGGRKPLVWKGGVEK